MPCNLGLWVELEISWMNDWIRAESSGESFRDNQTITNGFFKSLTIRRGIKCSQEQFI